MGTDVSLKPNEVSIGTANIKSYGAGSIQLGANLVYLGGGTSPVTGIFAVSQGTTNQRAIALYNGSNNTIALTADSMNPSWNSDSRQGGNIGLSGNRYTNIYLTNQPNVSSDLRHKFAIQDIPSDLIERLSEIKPKMYLQGTTWHFGYIAQDVERSLFLWATKRYGKEAKHYVDKFAMLHKDTSMLSLLYGELAVLKEQQFINEINRINQRLDKITKEI